jgi:hypothetical protein
MIFFCERILTRPTAASGAIFNAIEFFVIFQPSEISFDVTSYCYCSSLGCINVLTTALVLSWTKFVFVTQRDIYQNHWDSSVRYKLDVLNTITFVPVMRFFGESRRGRQPLLAPSILLLHKSSLSSPARYPLTWHLLHFFIDTVFIVVCQPNEISFYRLAWHFITIVAITAHEAFLSDV